MTVDLALARRAARTGLTGHDLARKLGVSHEQASTLADVGRKLGRIDDHALTASEFLVIRIIAQISREQISKGITRSPESRWVSARARKGPSWCASVVGKRLFVSRHNRLTGAAERGLGLVELAGNGFVWLTPTGWALIHAVEACS